MTETLREKILLSAVIPVTQMAGKLDNLRETLRNAEGQDLEIILVHDKQDDLTGPELGSLANEFPNLKLKFIEGAYGNPGSARNVGLRQAKGSWVVFWDSDDIAFAPSLFIAIKNSPKYSHVIVGQCKIFDLESQLETVTETVNRLNDLPKYPGIWRVIFKNEALNEFKALSMGEDQLFLAMNIKDEKTTYFSTENFYTYFTGNPLQLTGKRTNLQDLKTAIKKEIQLLGSSSPSIKPIIIELIARQVVTCLKYGNWKLKLSMTKPMIRLVPYLTLVRRILSPNATSKVSIHAKSPNVIISLTGGLGNQLFQFAAASAVAKRSLPGLITELGIPRVAESGEADLFEYNLDQFGVEMHTGPATQFEQKVAGYGLRMGVSPKKFEKNLFIAKLLRRVISVVLSSFLGKSSRIQIGQGVGYYKIEDTDSRSLLIGYFQSYKWVQTEGVLERFQNLTLRKNSTFLTEMEAKALGKKILCVHIRLGDYKSESKFGILDVSYYQSALDSISEKIDFSEIWIFSDEPNLAKELYRLESGVPTFWIEKQNVSSAETLEVMRLCSGFVIANSSFSWWAAMLSHNKNSVVVAPSKWFRGMEDPIDLIPAIWETLTPSYLNIGSVGQER
jgi:glycosyltransferase involved in cell wall biosynthesis